jgi:outer membrane protein
LSQLIRRLSIKELSQSNKNIGWFLLIVNIIALAAVGYYAFAGRTTRTAFIINQRVFSEFIGKQELEKKLNQLRAADNKSIDSLSALMQQTHEPSLLQTYQESISLIKMNEQQLSETYTADIWKQINQSVNEYGKQHGYDFIFGAAGNGSLMYGNESSDVTADVILFINKKYLGD